jgi:3-hydroxyacyl-CoA dehydrogenase
MSVRYSTTPEGVALVEIDNPPVNALSHAVRQGLLAALDMAQADPAVKAIVLAGAGKSFSAGADIREFSAAPLPPVLPDINDRMEAGGKPVVAAWRGAALGGGCELGLAAHARVVAADARIGLPEVTLGVVPGAGGTQRAPRLSGLAAAMDLAASGRIVGADEAVAIGLADRRADGDVVAEAIALAHSLAGTAPRRSSALAVPAADPEVVRRVEEGILKRARGQAAPREAARLVRLAAEVAYPQGAREERASFLKLKDGEESKALRYAFFAEREAGKHPALAGVAAAPVKRVGVAGAGVMGAGIAVSCLDAGFTVTVIERSGDAAAAGRARIEGLYARALAGGRLSEADRDRRLARLTMAESPGAFAGSDLVIEAVVEDMGAKQEFLRALEPAVRPDCVIATNTSYLDIDVMGEALRDPSRFLGFHFFSPANVMRLLEIVRGRNTSSVALATALAFARALGKISVVAGACEGFIGNRILDRCRQACDGMLEEGALPQQIDAALEAYGFAMGPYAVADLAGLDISWARRKREGARRSSGSRYNPVADRLCEMGRFGQKTGAGWYLYENGRRVVDPAVEAMVRAHATATRLPQRSFDPGEIVDRVLRVMASEGEAIVREGVAARASDIDVVLLNGYGFPRHKGGPMYQAKLRAAGA